HNRLRRTRLRPPRRAELFSLRDKGLLVLPVEHGAVMRTGDRPVGVRVGSPPLEDDTGVEGGGDVCAGYSEQKTVGGVLIAHPGDGSPEAIAEMGVRTQVELGSRQAENAAITAEIGV